MSAYVTWLISIGQRESTEHLLFNMQPLTEAGRRADRAFEPAFGQADTTTNQHTQGRMKEQKRN